MTDDWSLKNKKKLLADCIRPISLNDDLHRDYFFEDEVIETLRQELIEDIDSLDCTDKSKLKKFELIEEVLEIIDRRFGVDEND